MSVPGDVNTFFTTSFSQVRSCASSWWSSSGLSRQVEVSTVSILHAGDGVVGVTRRFPVCPLMIREKPRPQGTKTLSETVYQVIPTPVWEGRRRVSLRPSRDGSGSVRVQDRRGGRTTRPTSVAIGGRTT